MPSVADLTKLFSAKSAKDRIKDAVTVHEAALWQSLWLEKNAVETAVNYVADMEQEANTSGLTAVPGGTELARMELSNAADGVRKLVNYHLDKRELIKCKSKQEIDKRQKELWSEFCRDIEAARREFHNNMLRLEQGSSSG